MADPKIANVDEATAKTQRTPNTDTNTAQSASTNNGIFSNAFDWRPSKTQIAVIGGLVIVTYIGYRVYTTDISDTTDKPADKQYEDEIEGDTEETSDEDNELADELEDYPDNPLDNDEKIADELFPEDAD